MKRQPIAWVVEIWNEDRERWEPCASAEIIRQDALNEVRLWRRANPDDKFRVVKYQRVQP